MLLETESVVYIWPVWRQLVVVEVKVSRHGVDRRKRGVCGALRDARFVGVGQVRVGGARRRWRVLQLLSDDDEVFVLFQEVAGDVPGVVVHVLCTIRAHFWPVRVLQPSMI